MKPFYTWKATLNDGTVINQYEGETETMFKEVDDNMDELESFRLDGEDNTYCEVTLKGTKKAQININGKKVAKMKSKNLPLSLIYSRRGKVRVAVGEGTVLDSRITHRIGIGNSEEEIVCEIFPGLQMAEKKAIKKTKDKITHEETEEDIAADFD